MAEENKHRDKHTVDITPQHAFQSTHADIEESMKMRFLGITVCFADLHCRSVIVHSTIIKHQKYTVFAD